MQAKSRHALELLLISALAVVTYLISSWLDLLEVFVDFSHRHETWDLDELLIVTFFLAIAFIWYAHRRKREAAQAKGRLLLKNEKLEQALNRIRLLEEIIPICAWCKHIRDDEGYWHQLETYMYRYAGTTFSHGICPKCEKTWREETGLQASPIENSRPSSTTADVTANESGRLERGLDDFD